MENNTCSLLFILAILSCSWVQAQPRIGLKAGLIASGVKAKYTNSFEDYTQKTKVGPTIGVLVHWPISKSLVLRSGAELVVKGSRERRRGSYFMGGGDYDYAINQPLTYIDIPINFLYSIKSGKGALLIGGGPVASILLNSNSSGSYAVRSFDPGINIQTAYQWPIGFTLSLNHTRSLQNISSDKQYLDQFRNYYTGLALGYIF
jgi:hypothetical protein